MPNWCEGSLKVRGTKENITKFIIEGLHPVNPLGEFEEKLSLNEFGDIQSKKPVGLKTQEEVLLKV